MGLYTDKYFKRNYNLCEQLGMPKGCYFFSKAMTMDVAKKEVEYFLNIIKGKKFDYPIFMDYEDKILTLSKRALTNIAKYQLKALQDAGYWVGIYTSESHFNDHFIDEELKGYSHWVANYAAEEPPKLKYSAREAMRSAVRAARGISIMVPTLKGISIPSSAKRAAASSRITFS